MKMNDNLTDSPEPIDFETPSFNKLNSATKTPKSKKKLKFSNVDTVKTITPDQPDEPNNNQNYNKSLPVKKRLISNNDFAWVGTLKQSHIKNYNTK